MPWLLVLLRPHHQCCGAWEWRRRLGAQGWRLCSARGRGQLGARKWRRSRGAHGQCRRQNAQGRSRRRRARGRRGAQKWQQHGARGKKARSATYCASRAALWRSVVSIRVCSSCEGTGLAWASGNGHGNSCSHVCCMSLAVLRRSNSSCQASVWTTVRWAKGQLGPFVVGSFCWVSVELGPRRRRQHS